MAPTTDIAIIGGGPSGLALAGILQHTNITYIIFERSASDTPPQGGCLDLHQGSGQLAMQEAGCYEKFRSHGRVGDATIHQVWDHEGNKVFNWGDGEDEPEMDREEIKQSLLTTIPEDKIQWEMKVVSAERNGEGVIVLKFEDGTEATGFKLIVGADGANSHIRHLVCPPLSSIKLSLNFAGNARQTKILRHSLLDRQNPPHQPLLRHRRRNGRPRPHDRHGPLNHDLEPTTRRRSLPFGPRL